MRALIVLLLILFVVLQYKLWFSSGGYFELRDLHQQLQTQQQSNLRLSAENKAIQADVDDLKQGEEAIAEHARSDLGMVHQDEVYYQFVE